MGSETARPCQLVALDGETIGTVFCEVTTRTVLLDLRAVKALKQSPEALDLYCWATYRVSYLKRHTQIPWELLPDAIGGRLRGEQTTRSKVKWSCRAGRGRRARAATTRGEVIP